MHRNLLVLITLAAVLAVVGCKSKPKQGAASFNAVPICAPFDSLHPPTAGGVVRGCNAATLQVIYDGGDKATLGEKYQAAAVKSGWAPRIPPDIGARQWMRLYDPDRPSPGVIRRRA